MVRGEGQSQDIEDIEEMHWQISRVVSDRFISAPSLFFLDLFKKLQFKEEIVDAKLK